MRITLIVIAVMGCRAAPPIETPLIETAQSEARVARPSDGSSSAPSRILVTTQPNCPPSANGCDILEVLDLHTDANTEDKGFAELRARAERKGGDAVIGAEFEHGSNGEPSHLSGMIIRYGQPVPPNVVIGDLDIPSDEKDQNKGLEAMMGRAHAMGGDQVIDVTFEHGDDGAQGHLRGRVVRFTH